MLMKHTAIFSFVLLLLFGAASLTSCDKEELRGSPVRAAPHR
ncbi:hypothetical protein [uncultured Alistipes sp.]|nr:hypothetical protein [uncultured Alistipes sp.]